MYLRNAIEDFEIGHKQDEYTADYCENFLPMPCCMYCPVMQQYCRQIGNYFFNYPDYSYYVHLHPHHHHHHNPYHHNPQFGPLG